MRKMTLAASGGTEVAMACGRATWRSVWVRVRPSADADSHWMVATESRPERRASAM